MLELCFTSYDPGNIGIIDFHGANRTYNKEQIGGINLNIESYEQTRKNHALYNSTNKYNNIKSEMAGVYIRDILARELSIELTEKQSLIETLKELFDIFIPGKKFLGPRPTLEGNIIFPVELDDGNIHDINDLSSGEKEILYGYLRLRNASPKNSILLLDEPELHLNPRLIRGLPKFYQKNIGLANKNQICLVTHSDAFLRETVGEPGFSVFHMRSSAKQNNSQEQIVKINANEEFEAAFIDLVGDLAAYSPNSKVVIFEGGGDSDFDLKFVTSIFPDLIEQVNPISGENKTKVRQLHGLLDKASAQGILPFKFYSIVDLDSNDSNKIDNNRCLTWDVYHIENYLLEEYFISKTINDLKLHKDKTDEAKIKNLLKICAENTLNQLLIYKLRKYINEKLIRCLDFGVDPKTASLSNDFFNASSRSVSKISDVFQNELTLNDIQALENTIKVSLQNDLSTEKWKTTFRGRDILKSLVKEIGVDIKYETFRNLIISRMRDEKYKPVGMKKVINQIIND